MRKLFQFLGWVFVAWLWLFLLSNYLHAQSQTTVTGVVFDASGAPATSGFVEFDIQPQSGGVQFFVTGVGVIAPQSTVCSIDGTGNVKNFSLSGPCLVWGNSLILPANTTYQVQFAPGGVVQSVVPQECVNGVSYSLSNPVFCPRLSLNPQSAVVITTPIQQNLIPGVDSVFNLGSSTNRYASLFASNATINNLTFTGSVVVPGNLSVTGTFTCSTCTILAASISTTNATISNTLGVTGVSTLSIVNAGAVTGTSFSGGSLSNPNSFGNTTISSFTAAAALTLNGTNGLVVASNAAVGGALTVGNIDGIRVIDGTKFAQTMAGIQSAVTDLAGSGRIILPCGTYNGTATITIPQNVNVSVEGSGKDCSTIQLTTTGSNLHAIRVTGGNFSARDLTIKVQTPPVSNLTMEGIRFSSNDSGSPANPINIDVQRTKITGFNGGLFFDGRGVSLTAQDINRIHLEDNDISTTGCGNVPCESIFFAGNADGLIQGNTLDNALSGDHNIYGIRPQNIAIRGNHLKNTQASNSGVKISTENVSVATRFDNWIIDGNDFFNNGLPIVIIPDDAGGALASTVSKVQISNNTILTQTDTTAGDNAGVLVSLSGNSTVLDHLVVHGNKLEDFQLGGIAVTGAATSVIRNAVFTDNVIRNWSKSSVGTFSAIQNAGPETLTNVSIFGLLADGATNGRQALGAALIGSNSIQVAGIDEINVTSPQIYTFLSQTLTMPGSSSGIIKLQASATAGTNTQTFQAATGTIGLTSASAVFTTILTGVCSAGVNIRPFMLSGSVVACTDTAGLGSGIPMPSAGTIQNLRGKCRVTGSTAGSGAFTLQKNGVGQSLSCTIGNSGTTCSDTATVHAFSVAAGDLITAVMVTGAGETLADCSFTFEKQ